MDLEAAAVLVWEELASATLRHGAYPTPHHGYAVILEELDELWDEVKDWPPNADAMRREAVQVAASALRFLKDVC